MHQHISTCLFVAVSLTRTVRRLHRASLGWHCLVGESSVTSPTSSLSSEPLPAGSVRVLKELGNAKQAAHCTLHCADFAKHESMKLGHFKRQSYQSPKHGLQNADGARCTMDPRVLAWGDPGAGLEGGTRFVHSRSHPSRPSHPHPGWFPECTYPAARPPATKQRHAGPTRAGQKEKDEKGSALSERERKARPSLADLRLARPQLTTAEKA